MLYKWAIVCSRTQDFMFTCLFQQYLSFKIIVKTLVLPRKCSIYSSRGMTKICRHLTLEKKLLILWLCVDYWSVSLSPFDTLICHHEMVRDSPLLCSATVTKPCYLLGCKLTLLALVMKYFLSIPVMRNEWMIHSLNRSPIHPSIHPPINQPTH